MRADDENGVFIITVAAVIIFVYIYISNKTIKKTLKYLNKKKVLYLCEFFRANFISKK